MHTPNKHSQLQIDEKILNMPATGKVVCIGRNYIAHINELGNETPKTPLLFIKPVSTVVSTAQPIQSKFNDVPRSRSYSVHYETELCLRLGKGIKQASTEEVSQMHGLIDAVTVGLDLTLRDLQTELKDQGHPWERAKCFDGSCVLADWIDSKCFDDLSSVEFQLFINNKLVQNGNTKHMITPIYQLLSEISFAFSLQAGDIIMTGTPSGVGALNANDTLKLKLYEHEWTCQVI